jgi:hypothetical protein
LEGKTANTWLVGFTHKLQAQRENVRGEMLHAQLLPALQLRQ